MHDLWTLSFPAWHFVFRGTVVYLAILLLLRLSGKRQIGQMGAGEFVAILLISNAVQNAMNGGDNSITGGLILSFVLVFLSALIAYGTSRSKSLELVFDGTPRLLIHHGQLLRKNLDRELLSIHELMGVLRRQGIDRWEDVEEAVLETNGSISVTKKSETARVTAADLPVL